MDTEKKLRELYDSLENKRSILNILRSKDNSDIVEMLNSKFPMLKDGKYGIGMKVYWFVNGIKDFPTCPECGNPNTTNRCHLDGYPSLACSRKCSNGEHKKEAMRKSFVEKYGVDNPMKSESVKKKRKTTVIEKYGVDNVSKNAEITKKISETKLERYGDRNFTNKEKAKRTNIERYGSENPFGNASVQEKARNTRIERYGSAVPMHVESIRKSVSEKSAERAIHNSYSNYLMTNPYSEPAFSEEFYLKHRGRKSEFEFKCRKCGLVYRSRVHNGCIRRCPKCYPSVTTSGKEQEIYDFISSVYRGKIVRKDRSVLEGGKELDMYVPDRKLAFEFDGLYWHSELNGIGRGYHLGKSSECLEKGIQLVHIFEDEWDLKQEIVKSRVGDLLGVHGTTVYARKCSIIRMNASEERDFMERNHVQGYVSSSVCYGLVFDGRIVSAMSFSKRRISLGKRSKDGEYELLRFCSALNHHVIGAAGKLLSAFEREFSPKELTSYADRRWSVGNLYLKLGFEKDHESPPNYWYLPNGCERRFHRYSYRKSVLKSKLKDFDASLSEWENMKRNKFTRIWDCGNLVFVKRYENGRL